MSFAYLSVGYSMTCFPGATFTETKPFGSSLPGYAACAESDAPPPTRCEGSTVYFNGFTTVW